MHDTQEEHVEYGRTLRPGADRPLPPPRLLHRGDDGAHPRPRRRARQPRRVAYYDRLERESDLIFQISPYRQDSEPQDFSFDLSYSYYSPAYERPGPDVRVYRLDDCTQGYGT